MSFNKETVRGFTPTLFIGVGETSAFYTMRETYLHEVFIPGEGDLGNCVVNGVYQGTVAREVRSFHHFNLSQSADEAFEKACNYARATGLELTTKQESLKTMMRDIKRRDEEQMRKAREVQAWGAVHYVDTSRDRWMMENLTRTPRNTFGHGKYAGKTFAEINEFDRGYLEFMARGDTWNEEAELRQLCLQTFLENNENQSGEIDDHFGEIKTRYTLDVTVSSVKVLHTDYGTTLLIKMVGSEGHRFTTFYSGNKFNPKAGEKFTIKATVKKHDDYDGINQTIVNRIAVLGEEV